MDRCAALKDGHTIDFVRTEDPKCPHCGSVVSVIDNELWQLYEEGEHDIECDYCDLAFTVSTHVTYSFSTDDQEDSEDEPASTRDAGDGEVS